MSNMLYYRFRNTLIDLQDCYENMDHDDLDEEEMRAKKELIELCIEIAKRYIERKAD